MSYRIRFYAHCGMAFHVADGLTKEEAKARVLRMNRFARKRQPVTYLGRDGHSLTWEHETPENAALVSDYDGILVLQKVRN